MENQQNASVETREVDVENIIRSEGGRPFTTSLVIAQAFEKEHKNVLQSIENLECSQKFNELNFQPVEYKDAKGEMRPAYRITRDGFAFLAMGFTGKKAAAWKERFLEAFNAMEAALLEQKSRTEALPRGVTEPRQLEEQPGREKSPLFRSDRKLTRRQVEALTGLLKMECFLQNLRPEDACKELLAIFGVSRLEDLRQSAYGAVAILTLKKMFRVGNSPQNEQASPRQQDAVEGLISFWSAVSELSKSDVRTYIQNKCGLSAQKTIVSGPDALKVLFALWGGISNHTLGWRLW